MSMTNVACLQGMISYPNYKFAFTIWALGKYARTYGDKVLRA